MKKAIYKIRTAIVGIVSLSILACQTTTANLSTVKTENNSTFTNKANDFKDILKDDDVKCEKEKNFQTKADKEAIEDFRKNPPKEMSSHPVDFRDKPFGYYSDPNYGRVEAYSRAEEIPKGVTSGVISLIFKDEYKIRLKSHLDKVENDGLDKKFDSINLNKFSSLESSKFDTELSLLNDILIKHKISDLRTTITSIGTEQSEEEQEKKMSEIYKRDVANIYSLYQFQVNDDDIETMIKSLRKLSIVRESNYISSIGFIGSDANESNEPVFYNSNSLTTRPTLGGTYVSSKVTEDIRYHFPRVNAFQAWLQMDTSGVSTSSDNADIAVIDAEFNINHADFDQNRIIDTVDCSNSINCALQKDANNNYIKKNNDIYYFPNVNASDFTSHGTMVSSVIFSAINNSGSVGLASRSKILMISADTSNIPNAINYVREINKTNNRKIRVINISKHRDWKINGGTSTVGKSSPVEDNDATKILIDSAASEGILTVITAGNKNHGIGPEYKSDYKTSEALVVGGTAKYTNTRWDDNRKVIVNDPGGSCYGTRVDIAAPAENILLADSSPYKYTIDSGTSFAAPMVSSTAAMLMSLQNRSDLRQQNLTAVRKVKNLLIYSATPIQTDKALGRRNGNVNYSSPNGRLLNMSKAIQLAIDMPITNNYARIHNVDSYASFTNVNTGFSNYANFRDDKVMSLSSAGATGSVNFATLNYGCTYSMGYQVWKSDGDVVEYIKGIAGKWMPLKTEGTEDFANPVNNNWLVKDYFNPNTGITTINTGITDNGFPNPNEAYTIHY